MADDQDLVTLHSSTFDLSTIEYMPDYDDTSTNVVIVCANNKAFRIHDYFLRAESMFFREMFQDGTQEGPIGFKESSWQLHFIFDRITKRPYDEFASHLGYLGTDRCRKLSHLIELAPICQKYMFDSVHDLLHRLIARFAKECPPRALAFAVQCDPLSALIAKVALSQFTDHMAEHLKTPVLMSYFIQSKPLCMDHPLNCYSPAPENLSWWFVNQGLGLKAYYAYCRALKESSKGECSWDWASVSTRFLQLMEISVPTMTI